MTQTTRVPEVVAALVTVAGALKTAGTIDMVQDGPQAKGPTKNSVGLAIAVTDTAVVSTLAPMTGYDAGRYSEKIEVTCNAWSWSGGSDLAQHRVGVAAVHAAFMDACRADEHLSGICEQVVMGVRTLWTPQNDSEGVSYFLAFTVVALAYL